MSPSISAIVPAYRCADSILDVLDALFAQTLPCSEIIVVDDRSPDALAAVLEPVRDRIVYLQNERNLGLSKSYNCGLQVAKGDFILTLHSDCILEPSYLEKLYTILSNNPKAGAATGQYQFPPFEEMSFDDQLFSILNRLPVSNTAAETAVEEISFIEGKADLFRRVELAHFGNFDERLSLTCEDQDLSAKYRTSGFKLFINHEVRFSVKYNATQDSLWKILRKQRTYARGQAYVLLRYGFEAVKVTTRNRNVRALHRLSEVLSSAFELLFAALWPLRCAYRVAEGKMAAYKHESFWQPMDTFQEFTFLNKLWQEGRAPWKVW